MKTKYKVSNDHPIVQDSFALLDLLNESYNRQVTMKFTSACGGRSNNRLQRFTVPYWAIDRGETYTYYYIIHEFTHCLGYFGHGPDFKHKERKILKQFDITIEYARAYPKAIYNNGQQVYKR